MELTRINKVLLFPVSPGAPQHELTHRSTADGRGKTPVQIAQEDHGEESYIAQLLRRAANDIDGNGAA